MTGNEYALCQRMSELLSDEDAQQLFRLLEEKYVTEWKMARDVEQREHFWCMVQALHDFQGTIRALVQGKEMEDFAREKKK